MHLEHEREAELGREARRLFVGERRERSEGGDGRALCCAIAATRRRKRESNGGLEARRVGGIELEDSRVGCNRCACREAPLFEPCEVPERTEARADVVEALGLRSQDATDRLRRAPATRDLLEQAERADVLRVRVEEALEDARRARQILVRDHQERRELEAERLRLRGRGRLLGALVELLEELLPGGRAERLRPGRAGVRDRASREDAEEPIGDHLVFGRLGERARVEARGAHVVVEAKLVDLRGVREVTRALLRRDRVVRELLDRLTERASVARGLEDARDLLRRHRMDRVDAPRLHERLDGLLGVPEADVLDLREREPERDFVLRAARDLDARLDRLRRLIPAVPFLVKARLEGARGDVMGILLEDLGDERDGAGRVDAREDLRRAHAQREHVDAVLGELGLFEERLRERAIVADAPRGALEPEDRAAPPRLEPEDLFVRARRAHRIADELFPEHRDLLEVGDATPSVARRLRGLRVELDERAHLAIRGLGRRGRHETREVIEQLRVAGRGDPRRAQVTERLVVTAEVLGELRGAAERLRALRTVGRALRFVVPEGDAIVVLARAREQTIELLEERRVVAVDRERAFDVCDGWVEVPELLFDRREATELVDERGGIREEPQAIAARSRGLGPLRGGLVEAHEIVEDAAIDRRRRRRACGGALEERDRAGVVVEEEVRDARRVELETRAASARRLDPRFVREDRREARRVVVRRRVRREGVAHGPDARVEAKRALVGPARGVDATEAHLEDPRALDVEERGEIGLRRVRVAHAPEVRDEIFPRVFVALVVERATNEVRFEPLQRCRVVRRASDGELPRLARVLEPIACAEEPRALDEELDGARLARRDGELALEVTEHRDELRARVQAPSQDRVRRGDVGIDVERRGGGGVHLRVVAERLVDERQLDLRAREPDAVLRLLEALDARREQIDERRALVARALGRGDGRGHRRARGAAGRVSSRQRRRRRRLARGRRGRSARLRRRPVRRQRRRLERSARRRRAAVRVAIALRNRRRRHAPRRRSARERRDGHAARHRRARGVHLLALLRAEIERRRDRERRLRARRNDVLLVVVLGGFFEVRALLVDRPALAGHREELVDRSRLRGVELDVDPVGHVLDARRSVLDFFDVFEVDRAERRADGRRRRAVTRGGRRTVRNGSGAGRKLRLGHAPLAFHAGMVARTERNFRRILPLSYKRQSRRSCTTSCRS
ncbi:MAG: hypothetical protein QM702_21020 [Rubrivivax sp.]